MSNESEPSSSKPNNEKHIIVAKEDKHWATWVLDVFVGIGAFSQVIIGIILIYQLIAYQASNELTRQSLELSKKNFDMTAKSFYLTQKSIELAQKSSDQAEAQLKLAQQSGDISKKNLELSNTPWVTIVINKISVTDANEIKISYTFTNHSDSPAENVNIMFALIGENNAVDLNFGSRDTDAEQITLSPRQEIGSLSRLTCLTPADLIKSEIYHGKCKIDALITYNSPAHISRITCDQMFTSNDDGVFDFTSTKYDAETDDLINAFFNRQIAQEKATRKNK